MTHRFRHPQRQPSALVGRQLTLPGASEQGQAGLACCGKTAKVGQHKSPAHPGRKACPRPGMSNLGWPLDGRQRMDSTPRDASSETLCRGGNSGSLYYTDLIWNHARQTQCILFRLELSNKVSIGKSFSPHVIYGEFCQASVVVLSLVTPHSFSAWLMRHNTQKLWSGPF